MENTEGGFDREKAFSLIEEKVRYKKKYGKKGWGIDFPLIDFACASAAYASPQQYGPRWQKYMQHQCGWKEVKAELDRGDSLIEKLNLYIEIKATHCYDTKYGPGGLQVRPWQNVNYYLYPWVDAYEPTKNFNVKFYLLTKEENDKELEFFGSITHGTKSANAVNQNLEYTMRVPKNSKGHKRWDDSYSVEFEELKNFETMLL
jgi:hypothetical protein